MPHEFTGEPALEEVFADPIVQAMMRVDGLLEADLRRTLCQAASRHGPSEHAAELA